MIINSSHVSETYLEAALRRCAEMEAKVSECQLRFASFVVSVAMLFEKLEKEADDHPLFLAEISRERCRYFAANAREAIVPGEDDLD